MFQNEYIVLRSPRGAILGDPFGGPASTVGPGNVGGTRSISQGGEIQIGVETLEKRDIADIRRDPEVESIAPAIPISLIEPLAGCVDSDIAADDSSTWGVEATKADQSPFTGQGITVAVLDTGIDAEHSALSLIHI